MDSSTIVRATRQLTKDWFMRSILLVCASLLPIISSFTYIRSIIRGKSKPQRTTRFLIILVTALSLMALIAEDDSSGVWLALASFIQAFLIFGLAIKFGMGGKQKLDVICLVLCITGLILWLLTGQSLVGLIAAIVADFIAVIPSLHKTIRLPHTEAAMFYTLDAVAALIVISIGPYSWRALLYPIYLLIINAIYISIIKLSGKKDNTPIVG